MKLILCTFNFLFLSHQVIAGGNEATEIDKLNQKKQVKTLSFDHSYSAWTELLKNHVTLISNGKASKVDYKNFNKSKLNKVLNTFSSVKKNTFNKWSKDQQLAFYINTYNAYTIKLILNNYPIKSIKKIGSFFKNAWKQDFFKLFGEDYYLDKIEHKRVRESGEFKDARIHFAFNCASVGCPALLNEAWQANKLESQFDNAAKKFLSDRSRNKVSKDSVSVSNIFKWYGDDFKDNKMGYASLKDFFKEYASSLGSNDAETALLKSKNYKVKYSGYNWNLNE